MSDSTTKQIVQLRDWEDYVGETLRLIDSKYKYEYERHIHVWSSCEALLQVEVFQGASDYPPGNRVTRCVVGFMTCLRSSRRKYLLQL